jgi:hypothetical protein
MSAISFFSAVGNRPCHLAMDNRLWLNVVPTCESVFRRAAIRIVSQCVGNSICPVR